MGGPVQNLNISCW